MSHFLSPLIRFFQQKYSKSFLIVGALVFTGICFGQAASGPQFTENQLTQNIIEIFDLIFGLLALVLGPMVILAGWLLSPDWTMGDFFGLRAYFKEVWILVANIVYIIFALMLLWMAIMQIFGGAESEYAFKKKLPSFLVGILLVPFTWLIVSWTLSFANQAVAAVLSIPMGSISKINTGGSTGTQDTSMWHKKMLPTEFDFSTNGPSGYGMACASGKLKNEDGSLSETRCISPAEFLTKNQAGPFFIIMIYAYNIFKIQDADIQDMTKNFCHGEGTDANKYKTAKGCVENLMDIVMKFGLSLVVTVFFAIMLVALCWVLLMRAIKLWIYIMLSPLFGLAYFTGKGFGETVGEAGESGFGQVGFKAFFKLAMVPVLVSAVLAFGLLFVGVVRDNFHGTVKNPDQKEFCTDQGVGYMVTYCITETGEPGKELYKSKLIIGTDTSTDPNKNANITLNFGDAFSNIIAGAEGASALSGAVSGGISSVDDIFAHIILTMLALVFMFMGVKVAVQYDAVTKAAFSPFEKLGTSVGNFVAHSPSYLPLPHPAFAALTPAGMKGLSTILDNKVREREFNIGKNVGDLFDGKANTLNSALGNAAISAQDFSEAVRDVSDEFYMRKPEKLAQALTHSIRNVKTNEADELRGLIEANKGSAEKLGKVLEKRSDLVETVISQSGSDFANIRSDFDKAKQVGNVSANTSQERHVTLGTNNVETTVTGSPTSNLSVNIGGRIANIPKLDGATTQATNITDPGFIELKKVLNKNNKLNVDEAKKILGNNASSEQITALSRWIGLKE